MPVPSRGLLLVHVEPGPAVSASACEDWHDNVHIPRVLDLPGPLFLSCTRWTAADNKTPTNLALYELAYPNVVHDPAYVELTRPGTDVDCGPGLRAGVERDLMEKLEYVERRVYEPLEGGAYAAAAARYSGDYGETGRRGPGRYMSVVEVEMKKYAEPEFNRWFDEEHIPLLMHVPGWVRTRRFVLKEALGISGTSVESHPFSDSDSDTSSMEIQRERERERKRRWERKQERPPRYLAMHEWTSVDVFWSKEFKRATSTPWRAEVLKEDRVLKYEMRVFKVARSWEGSSGRVE